MNLPILLFACSVTLTPFFSFQERQSGLPNTTAGKTVDAYLKAYNSADDGEMRRFIEEHLPKASQEQVSLEQRIERYRGMKQMHRSLEFLKVTRVVESTNQIMAVLARADDNTLLELEFTIEPTPPYGLLSIRVERQQPGETGLADSRPQPSDKELILAVRNLLAKKVQQDEFSGVVLIAKHGKILFHESYGHADKEKEIANRPDTKFNLGSINKSFTKLAICQLSSAGKLSLDDPIKKYIPEYPNKEAAEKVTIRHLLDMTSGIGDFFGKQYQTTAKEGLRSNRDFLPLFWDKPLEFPPGTQSRYSNGGYIVLGVIIEQASGIDYHVYIREKIFARAEMTDSDSFEKDATVSNIAQGYTRTGAGATSAIRRSNYDSRPTRGSAAGGGYSTAADLLKYVLAIEHGILLLPDAEGGLAIAGGAPGINAAVEWNRRNGYVIIILSNYDPPAAGSVAQQIRHWIPAR